MYKEFGLGQRGLAFVPGSWEINFIHGRLCTPPLIVYAEVTHGRLLRPGVMNLTSLEWGGVGI